MADIQHDSMIARGQYQPSKLGTGTFVGLRILDGFILQRALQVLNPTPNIFSRLGWTIPPPPPSGGSPLQSSSHNLTPFQAILWSMMMGSALKHTYWVLFTAKETMTLKLAFSVGTLHIVLDTIDTLAFSLASINPTWTESALYTAIPVYLAGIAIEVVSETQRKRFKDDPKNKGKPYSGGLFAYARSINYFGFTLWRSAISLAAGGWAWGAFMLAFESFNFLKNSIPELDEYCEKRYGVQWREVKRKVPYAFVPGVI